MDSSPINRIGRPGSQSSETKRIISVNNKLKSELLLVINQMAVQLDRVKTKRQERLKAEQEASLTYGHKAKEIVRGERKKDRLKREIETMYYQLEHTYNNNKVTQLENDL